uniref:Uncharacterized protein n=1 Tax=Arundo donax TaxID=35708 RepID=A0A0A9FGI0_ARUDO
MTTGVLRIFSLELQSLSSPTCSQQTAYSNIQCCC